MMHASLRGCGLLALGLFLVLAAAVLVAPSRAVVLGGLSWSSHGVTVVPLASLAASSSVIGGPSLSAGFVDRVLSSSHSPALGLGSALYADSERFHIDDAFALAFFWHESAFGTTGVARLTHSLGNLICSGYATCYQGFRSYVTFQAGAWDWFRLIASEYLPRGLATVQAIVPVYAPTSAGNDVAGYIAAVLRAVATWRAGRVWVG